MADYKSVKGKVRKQPKKGKRWTEQTRRSSSRSSGGCAVGYIKAVGGRRHGKCVKAGSGMKRAMRAGKLMDQKRASAKRLASKKKGRGG